MELDNKNVRMQIAALVVLLLGVGWLAVDVFFPSTPTRQLNTVQSSPVTNVSETGSGLQVVNQVETVQVVKEPPEQVELNIDLERYVDPEILALYEEIRSDELKLQSKKIKSEIAELDKKPEETVKDKGSENVTFYPSVLSPTPAPEAPLSVYPYPENEVVVRTLNDEVEEEPVKPALSPVVADVEPVKPKYEANIVFSPLRVTSLVGSVDGVSGWIRASDRSFKVFEGMTFGDFLVEKITNDYIEVIHMPSKLKRKLSAPGIGYESAVPAQSNPYAGIQPLYQPSPTVSADLVDDGDSGIPIDMPFEMMR